MSLQADILQCQLAKGGTEHVVDELDRAMEDALRVVGVAVQDKLLVAGGAPEVELALRLRAYASTVGGREQLAIEAFANAMEVIPKTLAENAGLDQIDSLVSLRSQHEKGIKRFGRFKDIFRTNIQHCVLDLNNSRKLAIFNTATLSAPIILSKN